MKSYIMMRCFGNPGCKQLHMAKANKHNTKAGADQENSLPDKANETQSTGVPEFEIHKVSREIKYGIV
jgi:hypothetical protein